MRGLPEIRRDVHLQPRFEENLPPFLRIGTLEANNHGQGHANFFRGFDHSIGNPFTPHDASENIDENAFDFSVLEENAKPGRDGLLGGSSAHVQKVGGFRPGQLDHVHRGHGQSRPVHHTPDVPIQFHVIETMGTRLDLKRVFFVQVTKRLDVLMLEQRVVVKGDFPIECDKLFVRGNHQRVDLDQ